MAVNLHRLCEASLETTDGDAITLRDAILRRCLVLVIDIDQSRIERSVAEVAWIRERLGQEVDLIAIWPGQCRELEAIAAANHYARIFFDSEGQLGRELASPGKRLAVVVDPLRGTCFIMPDSDLLVDISKCWILSNDVADDHVIDLGDVLR